MVSRSFIALLAALALVGGASVWHLHADRQRVASLERALGDLRDAAASESVARKTLEEQVDQLEAALAAANAAAAAPRDAAGAPPPRGAAATAAAGEVTSAVPTTPAPGGDARGPVATMGSVDPDRLVAAGFRREEVDRFRARVDEIELKRLYLRDQATREGWVDTPRFAQESSALFGELVGLRNEFDEPLYDWVLYSTGHPNRVAVREVISGSAGESAGLRPGDVITRYDGQLMLSAGELRDATVQGRAGELVAIEVQREGETAPLRVFVPRGPIGITLAPTAQPPPPAG